MISQENSRWSFSDQKLQRMLRLCCQDPCEEAIKCIVREAEERAKQMTGKEAVNLAWAFSKMQALESV